MATIPSLENPFVREEEPRGIRRWIPGLVWMSAYRHNWIGRDIAAGVALTSILVPAGMAYAEAAGLSPIHGLYATIFPLIAYALFGPSRLLVLGPDSALIGIIAATVLPISAGDPHRAASLAAILAVLSGLFCIFAGFARFSFVADLLSKPVRYGYLNGIALTVIFAQAPKVLGADVWRGQVNYATALIGFSCLLLILGSSRFLPKGVAILLAVAGAAGAVGTFELTGKFGVPVVGQLPQGLPSMAIPQLQPGDLYSLLAGAAAIAMVSFADTSVLSRTFALRGGYKVNGNQEMIALGLANLASGLFHGFSVSASATRTPVAEAAGAKTQLTGLTGALCIAVLLIAAPGLLRDVPQAALAAVVVAGSLALIEIREVVRLYRLRHVEFFISCACLLGVAALGVIQGIFIAVAWSVLAFVWRAWRPYFAVLGHVRGLQGFHDIGRHPDATRIPGLVLFRWDAPLFFANSGIFREQVLQAVADSPTPVKWVVVAAEPVTDVDVTAADSVAALDADLRNAGIELCFAEMKGPVKDRLKRYGLFCTIGTDNFYPTIDQAVTHYRETILLH